MMALMNEENEMVLAPTVMSRPETSVPPPETIAMSGWMTSM